MSRRIFASCSLFTKSTTPLWGIVEISQTVPTSSWSVRAEHVKDDIFELRFLVPDAPVKILLPGMMIKFFRDPNKKRSCLIRE